MTNLSRVRVGLTGFVGGPGVATFYFLDTTTAIPSLRTFWQGLAAAMPSTVHIQVENAGDIINDVNGDLVGAWGDDPVLASNGGAGGAYVAPAGACVSWKTETILDAHRVQGRTFVVPLAAANYEADGTLTAAIIANIQALALEFIIEQSASFVIWHRPFEGRAATETRPAKAAHAGGHALVTSSRVSDRAAILRSRRD